MAEIPVNAEEVLQQLAVQHGEQIAELNRQLAIVRVRNRYLENQIRAQDSQGWKESPKPLFEG